ncbi:MAG: Gfo/Idh/MocA family oxidoreductase [Proteobacteria bacterium]|nr:Gfo/Idh/MocA family oxidoreductase [Pseudomonadota bacterium]
MTHRIGIIGLGIMGRRMAERVRQHRDFALAAMWDPDPAAIAAVGREHPDAAAAASADALVRRDDIDCVYIAAPPAHHAEHAHRAFDAGKAVFCEKPLTVDDAIGAALAARAKRERRRAAVNFSLAASPSLRTVFDTARGGKLGDIAQVRVECSFAKWPRGWQPAGPWLSGRAQGGFVREVVSHFIFATRRLTGPLTIDSARVVYPADGRNAETAATAKLSGGGIGVEIDGAIRGTADDSNLWTITGRQGALRMRDWYKLERLDGGAWAPLRDGPTEELRQQTGALQLGQLAALLAGRPHILPDFDEALAVQRTIEGLLAGR